MCLYWSRSCSSHTMALCWLRIVLRMTARSSSVLLHAFGSTVLNITGRVSSCSSSIWQASIRSSSRWPDNSFLKHTHRFHWGLMFAWYQELKVGLMLWVQCQETERYGSAPELASLLVFGFDVDDDGIDALLQEILHMIQAQLKQTVLVLNTETQTQCFDTAVTLSVCVCVC